MDQIDEVDAKILELLQKSGRMKRNAIAKEVDMSVPSVSERMRKLREGGVLLGYRADVDAKRLNYDITAFIRVTVDGSSNYPPFVEQAGAIDEVLEVHSITGEGSHMLKVRTRTTTSLERLLSTIQSWPGVHGTSSSIVLSTFKEVRTVPTEPMELYNYDQEEEPA